MNRPEGIVGPLQRQRSWLDNYRFNARVREQGRVAAVGDGVIWVSGLPSAAMDELLVLEDGSQALVLDIGAELIGAILLYESPLLSAGTPVCRAGHELMIAAGDPLLGRVVDPLGRALDNHPPPTTLHMQRLNQTAPPIVARGWVNRPLYTGIKLIDALIPIGKGQRQLLIGDEGLGRSALAIDAVINQRDSGVRCVYVLIGQNRSTVVNTLRLLQDSGAMAHTVVVVAEASALPGLQYLGPLAGCALAEAWMAQGHDTLVIYDDLTTHARIYRELSLLLRRPPGREAYPGDIFSVHARLLERSTALDVSQGGGSMTALPIVETQQGEIATYIPTNLISITDGQVYLDRTLFNGGFRPAVDVARSVSRIGGQAQHPRIKEEAGRMKLDYLQFLELEVFTRFGAKLEASMVAAIDRGRLLRRLLVQERLKPHSERFHYAWLLAFNERLFDPLEQVGLKTWLADLDTWLGKTPLSMDTTREQWLEALSGYIQMSSADKQEADRSLAGETSLEAEDEPAS